MALVGHKVKMGAQETSGNYKARRTTSLWYSFTINKCVIIINLPE